MSRIRRLSHIISEEGRRALASQQATKIRDAAFSIVDQANLNASTTRKITKKAAFTVVLRSLQSTRNLPFSLREHMALKELSQYITLAQSDKSNSLTLSHTDLLPISHPRSTRDHSMTASALSEARARWITDDPRITDERTKTILASALTAEFGSVEHTYYYSMLSSLPQGEVPAEALIAAGNPFSGGNSSAERSLRARLQRRDREGKFAFMGGGLSALVRRANGKVFNLVGRPVIDGPNGDDIQMQLPDGRLVNIPASKGMFIKAIINPTSDGFSKNPAKTATNSNIINEEDLVFTDTPNGWKKISENRWQGNNAQNAGVVVQKDKNGQYDVKFEFLNGSQQEIGVFGDWEDVFDGVSSWAEDLDKGKDEAKARLDEEGKAVKERKKNLPDNVGPEKMVPPTGDDGEGPKGPSKFEFKYPDGAKKLNKDVAYDPEGRVDEGSTDYSDDPAEIAQRYDTDDIIRELERGVLPEEEGDNATGYGVLPYNRGDEFVPVEALYLALGEQGEDAEMELAKIYDKALGGSDNVDALNDSRKKIATLDQAKPDVAESFERTIAMSPDEPEPATEPKFEEENRDLTPLPPLLEGLSESEVARFMETKDHTPFLPENEVIDMPEGYNTLDPAPFSSWREVTADTPDAVLPEGFSDNPVFISQSVPKEDLETELRRSIEPGNPTPGYANISLEDEDGEEFIANVPGEAVRDALQLQGVDTNELIKGIADEGFIGQTEEDGQIAMFPEEPQPKKLNAYEQLMADKKAEQDAINDHRADLKRRAAERIDELDRPVPEGWGISEKIKDSRLPQAKKEHFSNVYGLNNFEASVGPDGKITVKDRNKLLPEKSYDDWDAVQADIAAQQSEYSKAARAAVKDIAKGYGYSDEQIAALDSMSQQEIADFFANPDNQTEAHNRALDDWNNSWAVDLPSPAQRERWARIAENEKILAQAGDMPGETPIAELPAELEREPEASERKPGTATEGETNLDVRAMLDEEEALADKYQEEEGMDRGDAQGVAEADMKRKYGKTAFEALNELSREEALEILGERDESKRNKAKKTVSPKAPTDFEVDSLEEVPDGLQEFPKPADVAVEDVVNPANPLPPQRIMVKAIDLQPGDITVGDHFVIEAVGEKVPGTTRVKIIGHFPGHVSQDTKQWNEFREIEVIRGAQAPEAGDLPVLSKPKAKDFGKDKDGLAAAQAEYNVQLDAAKKRFVDPTEPSNQPHRAIVRAGDLKPGDVSADPKRGHFVIERTFVDEKTKPGFISVEGYYPGHGTQRKEWKVDGPIDVIRNVEPPAKGDLEPIHQPNKTINGKWVPDKDPEKRAVHEKEIADAAALWQAPENLPVIDIKNGNPENEKDIPQAVAIPKPAQPQAPTMPVFQGEFARIARDAGGDWKKFRELLAGREIVVFDFETTGFKPEDGNEPWQVGGVKMKDGKIIDRFVVYMNPGRSIAGTHAGSNGEDGKPNAVDADGNPLTDEYLAKQPDQAEAMRQFLEWMGPDALVVGQNLAFDDEVMRRTADKHGLDYAPAGMMDTLPMARGIFKDVPEEDKPKNISGKYVGKPGYSLEALANHFGIKLDNWHSADSDSEATAQILEKLIDKGIELDAGKDFFDVDARNDDYIKKLDEHNKKLDLYENLLQDWAAAKAIQNANEGKPVNLDEMIAVSKAGAAPDPEGINMGRVGAEQEVPAAPELDPAIIDFTANTMYPKGKMRLMERDWILDDANTVLLPRDDIRMRDLLPGDFMQSKDGNTVWQVVALRGGEEFGLEPGKVKVYRRNIETGEVSTYTNYHGTRLDGVRRAINPEDLNIPEGSNEIAINDPVAFPDKPEGDLIAINDPVKSEPAAEEPAEPYVHYSDVDVPQGQAGPAAAKVTVTQDGEIFLMEAVVYGPDGQEVYRAEGSYRTREGAQAEGEALIQQFAKGNIDQQREEQGDVPEARATDVPVSRGDIPAGANNAPEQIEVDNLPNDTSGKIQITSVYGKEPKFEAEAVVQDRDGDLVANQTSEHTTKKAAETEGRDFIARVIDAIMNPEPAAEEPSEPKKPSKEKKTKELSEGDKAVLKNNAFVEENAGTLQPTEARNLKVGDFLWAPFFGRYEEILAMEPADMGRIKFTVFNVYNNKEEVRYFEMDSPLRNVRRPGVEDEAEPIPPAKAAPRGGKRKEIKRKPLGERIVGKKGRKVGGNAAAEGFFKDQNGVPLKPGDVVVYKDEKNGKAKIWKRGVVKALVGAQVTEGEKAGGMVRDGVLYLDNLIVQWEGEDAEWAIKQGGREMKAKNLILQEGDNGDIALPDFRGGRAVPNAGRLVDPAKPARNQLPPLPEQIFKAPVADANGAVFNVSIIKIGDTYEGAIFNKDNKANIIAKGPDQDEVRRQVAEYVDKIRVAEDGNAVLFPQEGTESAPQAPANNLIEAASPGVDAMTHDNLVGEVKKMRLMLPKARADVANWEEDKLKSAGKQLDKFMRNLKKAEEEGDFLQASTYELRQAIAHLNRSKDPLAVEMSAKLTEIYKDFKAKRDADQIAKDAEKARKMAEPLPDGIWPDADSIDNDNLKALFEELGARLPDDWNAGYNVRSAKKALEALNSELAQGTNFDNLSAERLKTVINGLKKSSDAKHIEWGNNLDPIVQKILETQKKREDANRQANIEFADPIAKAEERIAAGENAVDTPHLKSVFANDDVFQNNAFLQPFKQELQDFFGSGEAQPLSKLSKPARKALNQYVSGALRDGKTLLGQTPQETDANIREASNLLLALRAEELVYAPNRNNIDVAQALKDINPDDIFKFGAKNARNGFVPLIINGVDTGFVLKLNENGVNANRYQNNFWIIHPESGQKFILKRENVQGRANAEVWSGRLLNALGLRGISHVERHPKDDDVIFVTFAGDNLDLDDTPNVYDKVRSQQNLNAKETAKRARLADLIGMMIFDGAVSNTDRHEENFLAANVSEGGVAGNGNEDLQLIPIDHGYAHRLSGYRGAQYNPTNLIVNDGYYTSREIYRELVKSIGGTATHHLIDLTVQQAIQELQRDNGGMDPAVLQDVIAQLEILRGIKPDKWAGFMGAKE